jgi:phosphate/sulfate permease
MDIFTVLLVILFATAIVDLIVGVSNDAVNFLNSAIGSRVASFKTILIVASLGILLGSTFSSGMMEIARNGLFNPSYFTFREVMYIFLAVMLTDIILLDIYNDFGLPTSTTVSLVFELLGAALVAGVLTSLDKNMTWSAISYKEIINFSSAITIVTGIFLSIFLAFFFGTVIQHISRIVFTFSLKKSIQKYGAIFSGLSITIIIYYLLIKGAKGSSFITDEQVNWVTDNVWAINFVSLVVWSILIQLMMWWWNINPLRVVVLLGTFALAMAFAGNDLVNFIGVAVGGLAAFNSWSASGQSADAYNMGILAGRFSTPTWILLVAGFVMIVTLWTNAKSRKVTETEVSLGRQDEGDEKFKSNWVSRFLVGITIFIGRSIQHVVPKKWSKKLEARFAKQEEKIAEKDKPSFDLVRAAVNLLVSSVLIAFGTSMKLPLSTTFVTFMVAMGSSFADQAWGRESAVYRVAGVMNVIAGWLITAVIAFTASGLLSFLLYKTGMPGVFVLTALAAFLLIRSHVLFARKARAEATANQVFSSELNTLTQAIDESKDVTMKNLKMVSRVFSASAESLIKEKKGMMARSIEKIQELRQQNDKIQNKIIKYVRKMPKGNLAASRLYILIFDHMQDLYQSVQLISESCINHLDNFHTSPSKEYLRSLTEIERRVSEYINEVCESIGKSDYGNEKSITERKKRNADFINDLIDREIVEIQKGEVGNRIGLLQMRLLLETRDMLDSIHNMYALYFDYHQQDKTTPL